MSVYVGGGNKCYLLGITRHWEFCRCAKIGLVSERGFVWINISISCRFMVIYFKYIVNNLKRLTYSLSVLGSNLLFYDKLQYDLVLRTLTLVNSGVSWARFHAQAIYHRPPLHLKYACTNWLSRRFMCRLRSRKLSIAFFNFVARKNAVLRFGELFRSWVSNYGWVTIISSYTI